MNQEAIFDELFKCYLNTPQGGVSGGCAPKDLFPFVEHVGLLKDWHIRTPKMRLLEEIATTLEYAKGVMGHVLDEGKSYFEDFSFPAMHVMCDYFTKGMDGSVYKGEDQLG